MNWKIIFAIIVILVIGFSVYYGEIVVDKLYDNCEKLGVKVRNHHVFGFEPQCYEIIDGKITFYKVIEIDGKFYLK